MKKFLHNKNLLAFIGFCIFSYIFYVRVIIERLPKNFTSTNNPMLILLSLSMAILFSILLTVKIYVYLKQKNLIKNKKEKKDNKLKQIWYYIIEKPMNLATNFKTVFDESLFEFDNIIKNIIPSSGNIIEYIGRLLLKIEKFPRRLFLLRFFILLLIPSIFVIEIIFFNRLNTFYKLFILILIPVIIDYFVFSLRIWYKNQVKGLNTCISIELLDYIDQVITPSVFTVFYCSTNDDPINYNIRYLPQYEETRKANNLPIQEGLVEIRTFLILVSDILFYLLYYDKKMSEYKESIYPIIIIGLYALGWIYLFCYLCLFV